MAAWAAPPRPRLNHTTRRVTAVRADSRDPVTPMSAAHDPALIDAITDYLLSHVECHGHGRSAEAFSASQHTLWRFLERGRPGRALPRAVIAQAGNTPAELAAATRALAGKARPQRLRPRRLPARGVPAVVDEQRFGRDLLGLIETDSTEAASLSRATIFRASASMRASPSSP